MNSFDWTIVNAIAELVGAGAVVATLIYLSVQIRQNTATVLASTELESARLFLEFHTRMSHSADMAHIWDLGLTDASRLSPDEKRRFIWLVSEYFLWSRDSSCNIGSAFFQPDRGCLTKQL
jgi:hypothetical protein